MVILVVGIFILSGLGAVAVSNDNVISSFETMNNEIKLNNVPPKDYTHTVFVEVGTATWCSGCPGSNLAWHSIYDSGNYNFEYCEMVVDKNNVANSHMNQYNLYWLPTSYFDGGQFVNVGTSYNNFYNYLDQSGARTAPDLVSDLEVEWLGNAKMEISYTVENNEGINYPGQLRIYVIELESTLWNDYNGNPYYHAFLDFVENKAIDIPAVNSISDTIVWDGVAEGYPGITMDNIQVILAVFDDVAHTSYSDPPGGAPFNAYYVDETLAAIPEIFENNPPEIPNIDGPTTGVKNVNYDFTVITIDPNDDDVYYFIDWGDGSNSNWLGPYGSGENVIVENSWPETGQYEITVKAKDLDDLESDWSNSLTIVISNNTPPSIPDIDGPTSGQAGTSYDYNLCTTDPDGDEVFYCINWDDGTGEVCIGPYPSGVCTTVSHTWEEQGTYNVEVKAKDIHDAESDWASLEVVMPVNQQSYSFPLLQRLIQRFPNAFPILQQILGI
jgi:hypothetical protein